MSAYFAVNNVGCARVPKSSLRLYTKMRAWLSKVSGHALSVRSDKRANCRKTDWITSSSIDTIHKVARPEQQLVHSEEDDGVREDEMRYCNNMSLTGFQQAVT